MRQRHRHRALSDRPGTRLVEPWRMSPAANRPGTARLERQRIALQRPAVGPAAVVEQIGTGEDVARRGRCARRARRPVGARLAPDAEEQRLARIVSVLRRRRRSSPREMAAVAVHRGHLRLAAGRRSADAPRSGRPGRPTSTFRACRRARPSSRARPRWRGGSPPGRLSCRRRRRRRPRRRIARPRCARPRSRRLCRAAPPPPRPRAAASPSPVAASTRRP